MIQQRIVLSRWDLVPYEKNFKDHVRIGSETACWPWLGGCSTKRGKKKSGCFHVSQAGRREYVTVVAHRVALFYFADTLLSGDESVHHTCNNPLCCNPSHLQIVKSDAPAEMVS